MTTKNGLDENGTNLNGHYTRKPALSMEEMELDDLDADRPTTSSVQVDPDSNGNRMNPLKLFKYGTALDRLMTLVSLLLAIGHGAVLPLSMILLGNIIDLLVNQATTQDLYNSIDSNLSIALEGFTFVTDANLTSVSDALQTLTLDQGLLASEENFIELLTSVLGEQANSSMVQNISCLVYTYASESGSSAFAVLSSVVNQMASIVASEETCACVSGIFEAIGHSELRCISDEAFLGISTMTGILWQVYLMLMLAAYAFIVGFVQIWLVERASEHQTHAIRLLYYRAILRQDITWFDLNTSGELNSQMSDDITKIHDGLGAKLSIFVQWVSTFFAGFIVAFVTNWELTLFMVFLVPFLVATGTISAKVLASVASKEQQVYAAAGSIAEEVLSSIRTVVALGREMEEAKRYEDQIKVSRSLGVKKGLSIGVSRFIFNIITFLTYAAATWFAGWLIQEGVVQPGDALTVFFAVAVGGVALGQTAPYLESLATAYSSATVIFSTIEKKQTINSESDKGEIPADFVPSVQFQHVDFAYPSRDDVMILKRLQLDVQAGQIVALVGPSGSGKSTTFQLIQRFYDVGFGKVLIGGVDVRQLNLKWLRSQIGVVSQEPILFNTTIAENIRCGRQEESTMEEIRAAARVANAHGFISKLPNGYDTMVGDHGDQLSGGQKQRIAIARVVLRNPKILLLDEATSALDTENEKLIHEALMKTARDGKIIFIIAHRLSTIQNANLIFCMSEGSVLEKGTHKDLMLKYSVYYDLVTAQTEGIDLPLPSFRAAVKILHRSNRRSFLQSSTSSDDMFTDSGRFKSVRRTSTRISMALDSGGANVESPPTLPKRAKMKFIRQMSQGYSLQIEEIEEELPEDIILKMQAMYDNEVKEVSMLRLMRSSAPEWWIIILGLFGAIAYGAVYPLLSAIYGEVLKVYASPRDEILDSLHPYASLFIVMGVLVGFASFFQSFAFAVAGENLTARLRVDSFRAMLRQEIGWHDMDANSTGFLVTRLSRDAANVQGATGIRLSIILEVFFAILMSLVIGFAYSVPLTLLLTVMFVAIIIAGFVQLRLLSIRAHKSTQASDEAGKIVLESVDQIRTVASLGLEGKFLDKYEQNARTLYRQAQVNVLVTSLLFSFSQGCLFLGYALGFGFGAYQVLQDRESFLYTDYISVMVVVSAMVYRALSIAQVTTYAPSFATARLSARRIFTLLDRQPTIDSFSDEGDKLGDVRGKLNINDVTFSYPTRPKVPVLQQLRLSVSPGMTLALVGTSGSGKSTIVSLIERFYDPQIGLLNLDNANVMDLNIRWLRSQIGIVSQEPVLFDVSIRDNIRYGASFREVSDEEIIEAAKAANVHEFITSLPYGYDTNVGHSGELLSGGEKQRIAIARALVRQPKILLLDEATSALDAESEKAVQEALNKASKGRTCIVIAHRLSTIHDADCIAVLHQGVVREQGKHSELLKMKGIYYKLNQYQMLTRKMTSLDEADEDVFL